MFKKRLPLAAFFFKAHYLVKYFSYRDDEI